MSQDQLKEFLPVSALVVILLLFLNQTALLMPKTDSLLLSVLFVVAYAAYSALFWREQAQDERDERHIMFAGRLSFLVGTTILSIGIIKQSLDGDIDQWLVIALITMILAKHLARIYSERNN